MNEANAGGVRRRVESRGAVVKQVGNRSGADGLAYTEVDMSTGQDALPPLIAPLLSGHSDLAVGSRPHRRASVVPGAEREFVSRCRRPLLGTALGTRFPDARCGFTGRTRVPAVPRRTSTRRAPAARTTTPAVVLSTGANTHLEYAS
ncbi:hypothetical protein J2X68_006765 [Streptomyces sp. 3330]|uniref:hypothetical protein n=1 Tax=Streptomyces sp. 3330 TaxID=2817755 RepID=UPI002867035D|nr:hypothetical protein [Streptomyces sp. 3330]MDR6980027.1 hypothetical protein [Streptomyces sp. 3330]